MNQHISSLLQRRWVLPTITGVVGVAVGAAVGYKFTKVQYDDIVRRLEQIERTTEGVELISGQVEEFLHPQLDFTEVQHHPSVSHVHEIPMVPELRKIGTVTSINQKEDGALEVVPSHTNSIDEPIKVEPKPKPENKPIVMDDPVETGTAFVKNIFHKDDSAGDEWDYKSELEGRTKKAPYVIHVDEYVNREMDYDQSTFTWYEKDQILADERDTPVYNWKEVVGELRFGHGSNDANVVFIRNDSLHAEYEVFRDTSSYTETVLGEELESETQEQELKHSAVLKFRRE